jgi:anti-sigma regulatory factor (Ser/Thr protein kinase)
MGGVVELACGQGWKMLAVINSDPEVKQLVEFAIEHESGIENNIKFLSETGEIFDYLSFGLPEIVIINFSDTKIDIEKLMLHIQTDKWLLSFGVLGIFSGQQNSEEDLYKKYNSCNVLTFLETYRIRSHLGKTIKIIDDNYQIIFQREFSSSLMENVGGSFTLDNDLLSVSLYAGIAATILAQRGLIAADNKMHLQLALEELLVNAIEHGNCGISYDEKTQGMADGLSVVDLVAKKCENTEIAKKRVEFQWEIQNIETIFTITDEGDGFDVKAHLKKISEQDQLSQHGRGIKIASKLAHGLKYNAKGNRVTVTIKHDTLVEHEVPVGFESGKKLNVKAGDVVLAQDVQGDSLYYIISGKYSVYHDDTLVGTLTPQDIFMGEMAFILNQTRTAKVVADTEGKLVMLTRKTLITVIKEYPQYGLFISKLLAKRLLRANERAANNK